MVIEISNSSSLQSKMAALNYFSVVILIRQLERHVSYKKKRESLHNKWGLNEIQNRL